MIGGMKVRLQLYTVTGEFKRDSMTQEEIMTSATKFVKLDAIADAIAAG